mmetsp:Transcript_95875/g.304383  ORF Transcript_95875/g.304383 Transcript_95875/m.304383 type:complete len:232 (-) Transcript_95875:330-1025(-)
MGLKPHACCSHCQPPWGSHFWSRRARRPASASTLSVPSSHDMTAVASLSQVPQTFHVPCLMHSSSNRQWGKQSVIVNSSHLQRPSPSKCSSCQPCQARTLSLPAKLKHGNCGPAADASMVAMSHPSCPAASSWSAGARAAAAGARSAPGDRSLGRACGLLSFRAVILGLPAVERLHRNSQCSSGGQAASGKWLRRGCRCGRSCSQRPSTQRAQASSSASTKLSSSSALCAA